MYTSNFIYEFKLFIVKINKITMNAMNYYIFVVRDDDNKN